MKKIMMAVVLISALAGLFAQGKQEEAQGDQLARIKASGQITVAMEGDWAPWTFHDENDKLVGFDTEVASATSLNRTATSIRRWWSATTTRTSSRSRI